MCLGKALICGEFPSNRIDYKSVDEKENDMPLGRQNEESDFIRLVYMKTFIFFCERGNYYALHHEQEEETKKN
jgi:hypothetical protein